MVDYKVAVGSHHTLDFTGLSDTLSEVHPVEYRNIRVFEDIIEVVLDKIIAIKNQAYEPNHLILWEGYELGLNIFLSKYGALYVACSNGVPLRFCGLEIIWTDQPDIIEVY